ncbi:MAG TPA: hypothetical protein VGF48_04680, partial [Thermoanaerobaculia bacterium]
MIDDTLAGVQAAHEGAAARPVHATRELYRLSARLVGASARLERAARGLGAANDAALLDPEHAGEVPRLLIAATERWLNTAAILGGASEVLFSMQQAVLYELAT